MNIISNFGRKIVISSDYRLLPDSVVGQFCCIFIFLHLKLQFALSNKKNIVFICVTMILCDDMLLSERILHWRIGASPVYFSPSNTFLGMLLLCNFILCIRFFFASLQTLNYLED
jgi:hypothetical protein